MSIESFLVIFHSIHSTYEELLARFKFSSLKISHIRTMGFETLKILNKESTLYLHDLVALLALKYNKYNFRYINTVQIPTVKTTRYGLDSFRDYKF
jgi:hypothetical protein